jgi:hypothetical protein
VVVVVEIDLGIPANDISGIPANHDRATVNIYGINPTFRMGIDPAKKGFTIFNRFKVIRFNVGITCNATRFHTVVFWHFGDWHGSGPWLVVTDLIYIVYRQDRPNTIANLENKKFLI